MGAGEGETIAAALMAAGKAACTPVAVVESASTDAVITYGTLASLAHVRTGGGPAVILLGDVYGEAVAATLRGLAQASQSA
jgi:siroheme synthase